jgi:hypothetical protein
MVSSGIVLLLTGIVLGVTHVAERQAIIFLCLFGGAVALSGVPMVRAAFALQSEPVSPRLSTSGRLRLVLTGQEAAVVAMLIAGWTRASLVVVWIAIGTQVIFIVGLQRWLRRRRR